MDLFFESLTIVIKIAVVVAGSMVAASLILRYFYNAIARIADRLGINAYSVVGLIDLVEPQPVSLVDPGLHPADGPNLPSQAHFAKGDYIFRNDPVGQVGDKGQGHRQIDLFNNGGHSLRGLGHAGIQPLAQHPDTSGNHISPIKLLIDDGSCFM